MSQAANQVRTNPQFAVGRSEAEAEIAACRLGYHVQGKLDYELCERAAVELKRRFDVTLHIDGHCVTPMETAARAAGYNERMLEEFQNRFDDDVIDTVFREVERKRKKEYKKTRPG